MIQFFMTGRRQRWEISGRFATGRFATGRFATGRFTTGRFIAWGTPGGGAGLGLTRPFNGQLATIGNGVMVALAAKDREQVDRLHALALSLGGTDEGAPGVRGGGSFYAAYFRDLDGNKLNVFFMG